jgi:colanic acid/amylovoran biosynthesis protein
MAMLEVAVTRIATRFPHATIFVLSATPDQFPHYRPNVQPLAATGRTLWLDGDSHHPEVGEFVETITTAALLVVAGMGGITDAFPEYALSVLKTLELAMDAGVPTAMMGQGIGPLVNPMLRSRAKAIMTRVGRIALREGLAGVPLLRDIGVRPERIRTTGDDAIEMAWWLRPDTLGTALGINLRAASYSGIGSAEIDLVRQGVQRGAMHIGAALLPIAISRVPGEEDETTISHLTRGFGSVLDNISVSEGSRRVVEEVTRCRVVITGSYHAGVFALGCGIPVIGIAQSEYYIDKFRGLADQFGCGCELVLMTNENVPNAIDDAVQWLWNQADTLRSKLLAAAERQVTLSLEAYDDLRNLARKRRWKGLGQSFVK